MEPTEKIQNSKVKIMRKQRIIQMTNDKSMTKP